MNGTFKINGGRPLRGIVTPVPNKNSIVTAIPAAILTDQTVTYKNVPKSTDVLLLLDIIKELGGQVDDTDFSSLKINCKNVERYRIPSDIGNKLRASILFVGPLLARFGKAEVPVPGGCVLGQRSISAHLDIFKKVGVKFEYKDGYVNFKSPDKVRETYFIWQSEASVTATENLLLYASAITSNFTLIDSACEPHVTDLITLLEDMGSLITGKTTNKLVINGTKKMSGAVFEPGPDHVDIAGYIVAAAITKGEIRIKNANIPEITGIYLNWFSKFGVKFRYADNDLIVNGKTCLKIDPKTSGFPMASEDLPKFVPRPWPGFPVDSLPPVVTLACKTKGRLLIQNWMYETGLDYIRELNKLGANIYMLEPQKVIVSGPIKFKGGEIVSPGIIQACMAIFLAALSDDVQTTIHGVDILKRRYPNIIDNYISLGADISVLS
jgi:UDP-N-acetylglucosamine 1-carboxyvinyltransferase